MSVGGGGSVCQQDMSKQAFNRFLGLVKSLDLPVSRRYNAIHGEKEIASVLAHMCRNNTTPHAATRMMKLDAADESEIPTSQWFLDKFRDVPYYTMERRCKKMLASMAREYVRTGLIDRRSVVAVDSNCVMYTGDRQAAGKKIVRCKPKGGASACAEHVVMHPVSDEHMPLVAVERRTGDKSMVTCLERLVAAARAAGMKPKAYLLDKGFYSVACMRALDDMGVSFVMPAKRHPAVLSRLDGFKSGEVGEVSRYTVGTADDGFDVNLVIKKRMVKKDGKRGYEYLGFITNVPRHRIDEVLDDVPETYRKRWRIENAFKSVKEIMPTTYSRNHSVRLLLYYVAVMACNLWYAANAAAQEQAVRDGVPRRRALKIHMFLYEFIKMLANVAAEVVVMGRAEARRFLEGGG